MMDALNTVPIISVVGKGDSGKTTFLEKLIRELADRGIRVATVNSSSHGAVTRENVWREAAVPVVGGSM
jgi:molybdopterin-guanine dinucleotide biosynthesis protein